MKFSQNQLVLGGLLLAIIIVGGVLVWIVGNQNFGVDVSLPKEFAQQLHEGIQTELQANQALVLDLDDLPTPEENPETFFLLQNVARSYQRELEWLVEKETVSFTQLQFSENNFRAQQALQNEIAYFVLFAYLQEVNQRVTQTVSTPDFDVDETIRLAEQEIEVMQANALIPTSQIQSFAQESGLSEQQIQTALQGTMTDFLEFKKSEFRDSVTRFEKAVMGEQVLVWQFAWQASGAPAS